MRGQLPRSTSRVEAVELERRRRRDLTVRGEDLVLERLEGHGDDARSTWAEWTARVVGGFLVWSWWSSRNLLRRR